MSNTNCRDAAIKLEGATVKVTWKGDCAAALYSYADTGDARWDPTKDQTLLDSLNAPGSFELVGCGIDFQVDIFTGKVITNVPQEQYGGRLKTADHFDGEACVATTSTTAPPSTTTSSTSTTVIETTTTSTTSTTIEEPSTTTSSTSTTALAPPTSTPSTSTIPSTTIPFPVYECGVTTWLEANRDIYADSFIEPWEAALDPDGDGIICESPATTTTILLSTTSAAPAPTPGSLPFTGFDATPALVGGSLLVAGALALVARKRLRKV